MKKNLFFKLFIFIGLITFIFTILNITIYAIQQKEGKFNIKNALYRETFSFEKFNEQMRYREPSGMHYNDKNIVLFGCAYTEGMNLPNNQTFAAILSEQTQRPVYNRGIGGGGIQHALIQVQSKNLDNIIKNSDYVIYTISALLDFDRLQYFPGPKHDYSIILKQQMYPKYTLNKKNNLEIYKSKIPIIEGSIIYQIIYKYFNKIKFEKFNSKEKNISFAVDHFILLNNEIKKINKNTNFIIFLFWDNKESLGEYNLKRLQETGIKIIELSEQTREKVRNNKEQPNSHPTGQDWELIVPIIKNELKL